MSVHLMNEAKMEGFTGQMYFLGGAHVAKVEAARGSPLEEFRWLS